MSKTGIRLLQHLALAALATCLLSSCKLERRPLFSFSRIEPQQFCPGDTVTASYDFLGEETPTCAPRSDAVCADMVPFVDVTSSPESFPPRRPHLYRDSVTFTPAADRVDVTSTVDRDRVQIPTDRRDADGNLLTVERAGYGSRTEIRSVTRITGAIERELLHNGMCAGTTPVNATVELPGPPELSPNLRLVEVCNRSPVPVVVTLDGPGATREDMFPLSLNQCMPTAGIGIDSVSIRPQTPDLSARCSAVDAPVPPAPLRTAVRLACR